MSDARLRIGRLEVRADGRIADVIACDDDGNELRLVLPARTAATAWRLSDGGRFPVELGVRNGW